MVKIFQKNDKSNGYKWDTLPKFHPVAGRGVLYVLSRFKSSHTRSCFFSIIFVHISFRNVWYPPVWSPLDRYCWYSFSVGFAGRGIRREINGLIYLMWVTGSSCKFQWLNSFNFVARTFASINWPEREVLHWVQLTTDNLVHKNVRCLFVTKLFWHWCQSEVLVF